MALGILTTATASLLAAACMGWAAWQVLGRPYSDQGRPAGRAFGWWWVFMAAILADDALRVYLGLLPDPPTGLYLALVVCKMALMAGAVTSLGTYVVYLWSGHLRHASAIGLAALAHFAWLMSGLLNRLPADVQVTEWSTRLVLLGGPSAIPPELQGIAFFLPGLLLAFAYGAVMPRLEAPGLKTRFLSVLGALVLVFVVGSIQFSPAVPAQAPWFPVIAMSTLLAGLAAVAGTRPTLPPVVRGAPEAI